MLPLVQFWIWLSAAATLAGWALSLFGELNRAGYAIFFAGFAAFVFLNRKSFEFAALKSFFRFKKIARRFRRPLPLAFLILAIFIFLGGAIYPPDNYTGLDYRLARILQWLSHGRWFWVHTANYRINDRACGIEWLSAPLLLFTQSTRGLFLLNFLPFLLMPGLIFSVLAKLGVRRRAAWQWMWLLPSGYNFILQAGSIANDTFPTLYALAAVDFALRARQSGKFSDLAASILSAALLTGAKASNLPLLLPWAVALIPLARSAWKKLLPTALVVLLAAAVSFLPTAIMNFHFCGDWTGARLEPDVMTVKNPLIALAGNFFQLLAQNFCPPLFPPAHWWNQHAAEIVPRFLAGISNHFNNGIFTLGELPTEDWAGLGFGLSILLAVSVTAKIFTGPFLRSGGRKSTLDYLLLFSPWISFLFYCSVSGMDTAARLIAPYYPLLLPLLLTGKAPERVIRRGSWRVLVLFNFVFAFAVLILTPPRPLWPAQTILSAAAAQHPHSRLIARARDVYALYAGRYDPLADVRNLLPKNISVVGFVSGLDDADISLWLPLGSRRVEQFLATDSPEQIRRRGIEYAVVSRIELERENISFDDWQKTTGARLIATARVTQKISTGEQTFYIVGLQN